MIFTQKTVLIIFADDAWLGNIVCSEKPGILCKKHQITEEWSKGSRLKSNSINCKLTRLQIRSLCFIAGGVINWKWERSCECTSQNDDNSLVLCGHGRSQILRCIRSTKTCWGRILFVSVYCPNCKGQNLFNFTGIKTVNLLSCFLSHHYIWLIWKACANLQHHIQGRWLSLGQIQKRACKLTISQIDHPPLKIWYGICFLANNQVTVVY